METKFSFENFFNGTTGVFIIDNKVILLYWQKELEIYVIEGKNIIHLTSIIEYDLSNLKEQILNEYNNKYYKLQ